MNDPAAGPQPAIVILGILAGVLFLGVLLFLVMSRWETSRQAAKIKGPRSRRAAQDQELEPTGPDRRRASGPTAHSSRAGQQRDSGHTARTGAPVQGAVRQANPVHRFEPEHWSDQIYRPEVERRADSAHRSEAGRRADAAQRSEAGHRADPERGAGPERPASAGPAETGSRRRGPIAAVTRVIRRRDAGAGSPEDEAGQLVHPLVLRPSEQQPVEPRLPATVTVAARWGTVSFHGSCGLAATARLVVRAGALRGLAHAVDGTPGQDVVGAAWDAARGALFIAVSDGLGSLPRSGEVAELVTLEALKIAQTLGAGEELAEHANRLVGDVAEAVRHMMAAQGIDGAATLVLAELRPTDSGAIVTVCGVGDSEAWLFDSDRSWSALHHERARGKENATRQLPGYPQAKVTQAFPASRGAVVLLGSDGFAEAVGSGTPLVRELSRRWLRPPAPLEFLAQLNFVEDHWTDDRAAVAVWVR
jgi:hypothetical protein